MKEISLDWMWAVRRREETKQLHMDTRKELRVSKRGIKKCSYGETFFYSLTSIVGEPEGD